MSVVVVAWFLRERIFWMNVDLFFSFEILVAEFLFLSEWFLVIPHGKNMCP